jgi:hypothetical protein
MGRELHCANGHRLRIRDDVAGKRVHCPTCGDVVRVPDPEPPLQLEPLPAADVSPDAGLADESADRRAKRRRRARRAGLGKVRLGVLLHAIRINLVLLGGLLLGVLTYVVHVPGLVWVWVILAVGLAVLTAALGILGSVLCLWVPRESEARGLIIGSLVLDLVQTAVAVGSRLAVFAGVPPFASRTGTQFLVFGAWVLFMLFLRRLAAYLQEAALARQVQELLFFGTGVCLGVMLLPAVAFGLVGFMGCFGIVAVVLLGLVLLVLGVGFLVHYVRLLVAVGEAIQ